MKTAYLTTRLAHATGGVSHDTSVYVWAPDSLVFNDLVGDLPQAEFERWKQIARTLGEGNVDFKVTHTLQVPKNSLVIYAPVRAVLRPDEAATLAKYVADGGALLYASDSAPETPDAKPLTDLRAALNATNVSRATGALDAAAARRVAEQKKVALNPLCDAAGVRTFAFSRSGEKFVLFVNTDAKNTARMTLDSDYVDVFSGQKTARGAIELPAGYHRLLRR